MKRFLLIFSALAVFSTYSRAQTFVSSTTSPVSISNVDESTYAPAAMEIGDGDQDENPIMTFYPNPVRENLNIKFRERGNYVIRIYNVVGAKVKEKRVEDDNFLKLDVADLQKGMYFLSFEPGNGKVITKTFTKEN